MFSLNFFNGKAEPVVNSDEVTASDSSFIWTHLDDDMTQVRAWLTSQQCDAHTVDVLCEEHTRPRLFLNDLGQCVAMMRLMSQDDDGLTLSSLRLLIVGNHIITISLINSHLIEDIGKTLTTKARPIYSPEHLLWYLFQKATDGVSYSVIDIDDGLSELEDSWGESCDLDINKLHQLRRDASKIKRFLAPQHDVALKIIANIDDVYTSVADIKHYTAKWKNTSNGMKRDLESLTASIERLTILQESVNHHKQDAINNTMYVLSLVATFFLPLTFVASLLGMNVSGIPLSEKPQAFLTVCVVMALMTVIQFFLFKRWKWIK